MEAPPAQDPDRRPALARGDAAAGWTPEAISARKAMYAQAVDRYLAATSTRYPVDAAAVAAHPLLQPVLWGDDLPPDFGRTSARLLRDPAGVFYGDPLAVAANAAGDGRRLLYVYFPGDTGGASPSEAARDPRAVFWWESGNFPLTAAALDDGTLIFWAGDAEAWTTARPASADLRLAVGLTTRAGGGGEGRVVPSRPPVASASRGAEGEKIVARALARGGRGYPVRDVTRRAKSADFLVETPVGTVLIDAKNYTSTLPSREVTKFLEDLDTRGAAGGVLVSLESGIVGRRGVISSAFEMLPEAVRRVPVVYVASAHPDVIAAGVDIVTLLATSPGDAPAASPQTVPVALAADTLALVRTRVRGFAEATARELGVVCDEVGGVVRELRRRTDGSVAAAALPAAATLPAALDGYAIPRGDVAAVAELVRRVERDAAELADTGATQEWTRLKQKIVHTGGTSIRFLKTKTMLDRPLLHINPHNVTTLVGRYPGELKIDNGYLSIPITHETLGTVIPYLLW